MKLDGSWVDNQLVVNSIRQLLDVEFNALGYEYITHELRKEYLINKKKRGRPCGVSVDAGAPFNSRQSDPADGQAGVR